VHSTLHSLSLEATLEALQTAFRILQDTRLWSKDRFTNEMVSITLEVYAYVFFMAIHSISATELELGHEQSIARTRNYVKTILRGGKLHEIYFRLLQAGMHLTNVN